MTAIYLPLQDNRTYLNINNPWKICDRIEDTYVVRSHHFGIVDHAMSLTLNPSPILLCPTLFLSSLDFVIHLIKTFFFVFVFVFYHKIISLLENQIVFLITHSTDQNVTRLVKLILDSKPIFILYHRGSHEDGR